MARNGATGSAVTTEGGRTATAAATMRIAIEEAGTTVTGATGRAAIVAGPTAMEVVEASRRAMMAIAASRAAEASPEAVAVADGGEAADSRLECRKCEST
jgi:hypothetical protein